MIRAAFFIATALLLADRIIAGLVAMHMGALP